MMWRQKKRDLSPIPMQRLDAQDAETVTVTSPPASYTKAQWALFAGLVHLLQSAPSVWRPGQPRPQLPQLLPKALAPQPEV